MNIKTRHFISLFIFTSFLTACGSYKPKVEPNTKPSIKETHIKNEGSICLFARKNNDIKVYYFPQNSACSSSTLHHWSNEKLTATPTFRKSLKGSIIEIDASITHRRSDTRIASADCAGAGIQSKLLPMKGRHRFEVYWDNHKLGDFLGSKDELLCKKMDKKGRVTPAGLGLYEYVRRVARFEP